MELDEILQAVQIIPQNTFFTYAKFRSVRVDDCDYVLNGGAILGAIPTFDVVNSTAATKKGGELP